MDALVKLGRVAGVAGAVLCAVGAGVRLSGAYWIAGFQAGTLLLGGSAVMVFGCFCLLVVLTQRP
jgi:hypothetical protein